MGTLEMRTLEMTKPEMKSGSKSVKLPAAARNFQSRSSPSLRNPQLAPPSPPPARRRQPALRLPAHPLAPAPPLLFRSPSPSRTSAPFPDTNQSPIAAAFPPATPRIPSRHRPLALRAQFRDDTEPRAPQSAARLQHAPPSAPPRASVLPSANQKRSARDSAIAPTNTPRDPQAEWSPAYIPP